MIDLIDGIYQCPQFGKFFWSFSIVDSESLRLGIPIQTVELFIIDLARKPSLSPSWGIRF